MTGRPTNWAGNVTFGAARFHRPTSVGALQAVVAASAAVRALGTGHSFNQIADTAGDLVSVAELPALQDIDTASRTVVVSAGSRYGELAGYLHKAGYALPNLGSLSHISVAGACATGTHGSGDATGNLATAVAAIEMVTAGGELVRVSRASDPDRFAGAVLALGSLGVVTAMTLDIEPTYDIAQYVYDGLPADQLAARFDEIFSSAYSVSVFTRWDSKRTNQVWLKRKVDVDGQAPGKRWLGAVRADGPRHPIPGAAPVNCTWQLGVPGPWHERLPHFRLDFTPSSGAELQSEYLLPRLCATSALSAIEAISERIAPLLQICEIRTVAADDLWLSPSQGRNTVAFHFTWVKDAAAVAPVVAAIEGQLAPYDARPHWGKVFSTSPAALARQYERWENFRGLMSAYDPAGKFRNEWIERYFGRAGYGDREGV